MIYLLFQHSFYVDLFDYVCELVTGLVLELPPHRFDRIKPQYILRLLGR